MQIITDSASDLPIELAEKLDITVVPMQIEIDGIGYQDGIDLFHRDFYEKMNRSKNLPKTSQPSTGSFIEAYKKALEKDNDVLSIHMSSKISGTFNGASMAAKQLGQNIRLFDSLSGTMGTGLMVLNAAQMRNNGLSTSEIISNLETLQSNVKVIGYLDSLKNAVKGGRVKPSKRFVTELMNVKPITSIENGNVEVIHAVRGKEKAHKYIAKIIGDSAKELEKKQIAIVHCDAEDNAKRLDQIIKDQIGDMDTIITTMGPVNSTHVGTGGISVCVALTN
ncbi:MAG: DegV family protein [Tindallia sp. MSAO_Bac2]|nr:MAG: DegV family protein [Tindallia sp. MSAO_Bac2]